MKQSFQNSNPSWQNSLEVVNGALKNFICPSVFSESKPIRYGIFEPVPGDIAQLTVEQRYRCREIGSLLSRQMFENKRHRSIQIIDTGINSRSIATFLKPENISLSEKQVETIKML